VIEEYIDEKFGHTAPGTQAKIYSVLSSFFKWHHVRGRINGNPIALIDRPKSRKSDRQAHLPHKVLDIVRAQPLGRDRCALLLLGKMGFARTSCGWSRSSTSTSTAAFSG
jgi:site-specific recombinase XerD